MKLRLLLSAIFSVMFLITPVLRAGPQIQNLVSDLASDDPRQRFAALDGLMSLKRPDLRQVRAAAIAQSPLLPGQIAQLRQAVIQVFLAGEPFKVDPADPRGFLGVQFSMMDAVWHSDGVTVGTCLPGFPAYRCLRPQDIIVKLLDYPKVQLHTSQDLIDAVKYLDAGQVVRLGILRAGLPMTVSLPLDFRPVDIPVSGILPSDVDLWFQKRMDKAQAYWTANFSVIDPAASAEQASTSLVQ